MAIGLPDIEGITLAQVREEDLAIAGETLPQVTNFNSGGVLRRLVELLSRGKHAVYEVFATKILPQAYFRSASQDWLRAKARDINLDRLPAVTAQGEVTFTREDASGNAPILAGGLVGTDFDANGNRFRFRVLEDVVAANGQATVRVPVEAEAAGQIYNVGAGTITQFITPFPRWDSVTNETDWLTAEGRDEEEDGRALEPGEDLQRTTGLRRRIGEQWQAGNRCNWAAYSLAARTAGAVDVVVKQLRGAGTVDVYITGPTGLPSESLIAAVEAALGDPEYGLPATDDWAVWSPTGVPMDWNMTLVMNPGKAGDVAGLQAQALAVLNALHNPSAPVAGVEPLKVGQDVILQQVFQALRLGGLGGLKKVTFTSPAADVAIGPSQLAVLGAMPVITVTEASEE